MAALLVEDESFPCRATTQGRPYSKSMNIAGGVCKMSEDRIAMLTAQGKECVKKYSQKAMKATFVPFLSIPLVHGLCAAMQSELDKIFGVSVAKDERYSNIAIGALVTPFMAVPLWGAVPAKAYIETVGESYLKALIDMCKSAQQIEWQI